MEKTKIIFINLVVTSVLMLGFAGYFEWRMKSILKSGYPENSSSIQDSSNDQNVTKSADVLPQESGENLNKKYEPPTELFYSGDKVPGYASGEIVAIDDRELILKQPASIDLKYQIFRTDVAKVVEINMEDPQRNPNGNIEMKETPSDWNKIKVGSKVNIRLDENQRRVLAIVKE